MSANLQPDRLWANLRTDADGLLPCVTQDLRTRAVLMVAWVSREALERTLSSGYAVYYSRSRRRLWEKGASSGKRQRIVQVRLDADADTLLYLVDALLPAAPDGNDTYFNFRQERRTWIWDPIHLRDHDALDQLCPPEAEAPSEPPSSDPGPEPSASRPEPSPAPRDPGSTAGSRPTAPEPRTAEQAPSELRTEPPDDPPQDLSDDPPQDLSEASSPDHRATQRSPAAATPTTEMPPALVIRATEVCAQAETTPAQLAEASLGLLRELRQTLQAHNIRLDSLLLALGNPASPLDTPDSEC